jgi:hypothetical protein
MKHGVEVEGRLKGVPTIFVDAQEYLVYPERVKQALADHKTSHLYISDPENVLPYNLDLDCLVTLDVTRVRYGAQLRPSNVLLMLRIDPNRPDAWEFDDLLLLGENDQIKFEQNQHVYVFPWSNAIKTQPEDFNSDVTLP